MKALLAAILLVALVAAPARAADDSVAAARDLYASAAYEDALAVLNRLHDAGAKPADEKAIEQYRALCLLALGRNDEAEQAIAAVVTADPTYHPTDDVSPRVRAAFSDVRRKMLPGIIEAKYAESKGAFEQKQYAHAADGFAQVLSALGDPDVAAVAGQPPLSDLRVLATGFHELSVAAAAPPPPPPPPPPAPKRAAPPAVDINRIYDGSEGTVVPPVIIRQVLPAFPGRIIGQMHGVLEVVIDPAGTVESATMREKVNSYYDTLVLSATKTWKYQPASVNGVAVRFRKIIQIAMTPSS